MYIRSVHLRTASAVAGLAIALSACGLERAGGGITGSISGDGSSTVLPITEATAEEFQRENPRVDIAVRASGTGGGFEKFCNGETDIQDASRPIKDEEKRNCEKRRIRYVELTVALDGLAVVVHPESSWVDCLTTEELKRIWEPGSTIERWSQVRAGFPDMELKLFGAGTDSGTFDFFTDQIAGEEGASRADYTASENDDVLVQGVAGTRGSLGYFAYAYFAENRDKLKVLGVDGGEGCIIPSDDTVRDDTYNPLSRPLFVYVKVSSLKRQEVASFMTFFLDNVSFLATDVGYTSLAPKALAEQRAKLVSVMEGHR